MIYPRHAAWGVKHPSCDVNPRTQIKEPHIDLVQKSIQPDCVFICFWTCSTETHGWYIDYIDVDVFEPHLHRQWILLPPLLALVDSPNFSTLESWLKKKRWSVMKVHHRCQLGWVSHSWISMALRDVKRPRNSFGLTVATNCVTRFFLKTFIREKLLEWLNVLGMFMMFPTYITSYWFIL